jgi:hypothetical protein
MQCQLEMKSAAGGQYAGEPRRTPPSVKYRMFIAPPRYSFDINEVDDWRDDSAVSFSFAFARAYSPSAASLYSLKRYIEFYMQRREYHNFDHTLYHFVED